MKTIKPVGSFFGGLRKYRDGFNFLHYVYGVLWLNAFLEISRIHSSITWKSSQYITIDNTCYS